MSTFGRLFRVTTFGESHCEAVGCIVDGVPAGMDLTVDDIQPQLTRRRPGQSKLTTPRDEKDLVKILSGCERGKTLGTPICLVVPNENIRPGDYAEMSTIPRPGHADYTYQQKYGIRASSGGGRSSARETIGRVASGAIAEKWLTLTHNIEIVAWVSAVGSVKMPPSAGSAWSRAEVDRAGTLRILVDPAETSDVTAEAAFVQALNTDVSTEATTWSYQDVTSQQCYSAQGQPSKEVSSSSSSTPRPHIDVAAWQSQDVIPVRCPHLPTACQMSSLIRQVKHDSDSIGGTVTCVIRNVPVGWGEPCFDKLEALLAHAMLSLPATKGFEIGSGFAGIAMRGSAHNDLFKASTSGKDGLLETTSNHAGGTLGGISSGQDLCFSVAIKPVSTIGKCQKTVDFSGNAVDLEAKGRHDACVLPRAVPLVEMMAALVLADLAMLQKAREWKDMSSF